jgi:hypothetical protein
MATKIKLMKMLQEMHGFAEMGCRCPASRLSPLYLLQLRSHVTETSRPRRHRLAIRIDLQDSLDMPHPVKITHITPDAIV